MIKQSPLLTPLKRGRDLSPLPDAALNDR